MSEQQEPTTAKASHWILTLNNPTTEEREILRNLPKFVRRFKYQDEIGHQGTLHIQGYIHTETIRMSALKKWLPRAHLEVCRNKDAAIKYVEKQDTAVAGTQHDVKNTFEQVSMMDNLIRIAEHHRPVLEKLLRNQMAHPGDKVLTPKQLYEEEYWQVVNLLVAENPDLIATYTMPNLLKGWVHCRFAVIQIWQERENQRTAGQPDNNGMLPPPELLPECPECGENNCQEH